MLIRKLEMGSFHLNLKLMRMLLEKGKRKEVKILMKR